MTTTLKSETRQNLESLTIGEEILDLLKSKGPFVANINGEHLTILNYRPASQSPTKKEEIQVSKGVLYLNEHNKSYIMPMWTTLPEEITILPEEKPREYLKI